MISSKIKSLYWFVERPQYIPHALYVVLRKFKRDHEHERPDAEAWCRERCVTTQVALERLTQVPQLDEFREIHRSTVARSEQRVDQCPVEMGGAADLDLLYHLARSIEATRVIETGVAYGWSSLALLAAIADNPAARLISIDLPYLPMKNDDHVGCAVPDELRTQWKLVRQSDRMALPGALAELGTVDLCHYDSDKSWHGRMWSYPMLWQSLRPGGIFVSDDVGDNFAFRDFCDSVSQEPLVVAHQQKFIGLLRK